MTNKRPEPSREYIEFMKQQIKREHLLEMQQSGRNGRYPVPSKPKTDRRTEQVSVLFTRKQKKILEHEGLRLKMPVTKLVYQAAMKGGLKKLFEENE